MLAKGFSVPELLHPPLPAAPAWWPLPPGWIVLAAIVAVLTCGWLLLRLARYRRNRWRRDARTAMSAMQSADDWLLLIKRVLLVHHARPEVSQWQTPQQLLQQLPLDEPLRRQLSQRYCQPDTALEPALNQQLHQQVNRWLEGLPDV
jgi:hypothetical protein